MCIVSMHDVMPTPPPGLLLDGNPPSTLSGLQLSVCYLPVQPVEQSHPERIVERAG